MRFKGTKLAIGRWAKLYKSEQKPGLGGSTGFVLYKRLKTRFIRRATSRRTGLRSFVTSGKYTCFDMQNFTILFTGSNVNLPMIFVKGTHGRPYLFGAEKKVEINVNDFYISQYPVTQAVWEYIMGSNPAVAKGLNRPVENVSFNDIVERHGFLERINGIKEIVGQFPQGYNMFRLPTETEWEYAARGGVHWRDDFLYSGSNNITEVAWQSETRYGTETHPVGEKKPNQLGIHDMCGNVWEWCQDYFHRDIIKIPTNGTALLEESDDRVLRGGCHHNWAIHCTVSKRYEIGPQFKDGCIGFRLVLAANASS